MPEDLDELMLNEALKSFHTIVPGSNRTEMHVLKNDTIISYGESTTLKN